MSSESFSEIILEKSRKDSGLEEKDFKLTAYDLYCVPLELYRKYKDDILRLSLSYQRWVANPDGGTVLMSQNQLTDRQIAKRLDLLEEQVRRVRCMAEWDIPMEVWRNSAEFKRRCRLQKPLGIPRREIRTEPS